MAITVGRLVAYLTLDPKQFKSGAAQAERAVAKLAGTAQKVGAALSIGVTAPLIAAAALAVKTSARYEELETRFDNAFEGMAGSVRDWSKQVADATNQSNAKLQEFTSGFGGILRSFKLGAEDAATFSKALTTTGLALADIHASSPEKTMAALEKAIRGSARALGEYKIIVDKDEISQQLLNAGITGGATAASKAQVALATLKQILLETEQARKQADFGSTTDLLEGMKNTAIDIAVAFGDILRPSLDGVLRDLLAMEKKILSLSDAQKKLAVDILKVVAVTGPLLTLVGGLVLAFGGWGTVAIATAVALAAVAISVNDTDANLRDLARTLPLVGRAIDEMVTTARINWLSLKEAVLETNESMLAFETGKGVGGPVGGLLRLFSGAAGKRGLFGVKVDTEGALAETRSALEATRKARIAEENRFAGIQLEKSQGGPPITQFKLPELADSDLQKRLAEMIKTLPLGSEFTRRLEESLAKKLAKEGAAKAKETMRELAAGISQIDSAFASLDAAQEQAELGEFNASLLQGRRELESMAEDLGFTTTEVKELGDAFEKKFRGAKSAEGLRDIGKIVKDLERDFANVDLSDAEREVADFNAAIAEIQDTTKVSGQALEDWRARGIAAIRGRIEEERKVTLELGKAVSGAFRGTISGILSGDREFNILEQFRDTGVAVIEDMFAQWIEKKLLFDQKFTLNIEGLGDKVKELAGGMATNFGRALEWMGEGIQTLVTDGIKLLKDLLVYLYKAITSQQVLNALKSVGGAVTGVLNLVGLAEGGKVKARPGGTPYILGEGGEDEWVVPESKMRRLTGTMNSVSERTAVAPVEVNVYSSQPAQTRQSRTSSGGQSVDVFIGDSVARDIVRGGPVGQAIDKTRGTKRLGVDR